MKKLALTGSVLLVVAALSCTRELDVNQPEGQEYVFEAVWADGSDTRTAIQADGTSVWWTVSEEINVFYGAEASGKFTSTNTEPSQYARFTGTLPVLTGTVEEGNGAEAFWGVYPYDAANTCDGESVTLTIPANQSATEGTFADKFFPAVGRSNDFAIAFYNVCGGVRFSVANTGIESVVFQAIGNENLVGKVKVAFGEDGKPVIQQVTDGSSEVMVNAPSGGFVPGKYYFAALLPGTLAQGLKVTYVTASQSASIDLDQSLTVNRSRFGIIENKDADLFSGNMPIPEIVDLGLSVKWGSFNVGASKPEESGNYYAWGEIEPKEYYMLSNYKWCWTGSEHQLLKYCTDSSYGYHEFTDGKTVLDLADDAAYVNLGRRWRMPTRAELKELKQCTWEWTIQNGVYGGRVIGPNGNSIFLPAAGHIGNTTNNGYRMGSYASSSLRSSTPDKAYLLSFLYESYVQNSYNGRSFGCTIRPVYDDRDIPVESVSLNKTGIELRVHDLLTLTATVLPANTFIKDVTWSSSDESVAIVSSTGVVTGVGVGTATITATTVEGGKTANCTVTVKENTSSLPVPEAVDLGLSVRWASFNLGASKPEGYGYHYAWGELQPKSTYDLSTYKFYQTLDPDDHEPGHHSGYTKYCNNESEGYNGFTDNKKVLDLEDDAAHAILGGKWRMPTNLERSELEDFTTFQWTIVNGVEGAKATSKRNGESIFFPATGYRENSDLISEGSICTYWNTELWSTQNYYSYRVLYAKPYTQGGPVSRSRSLEERIYGHTIRAVYDESLAE